MIILQGIPSYFGNFDSYQSMTEDLSFGEGSRHIARCSDMDDDYSDEGDLYDDEALLSRERDEWSDEPEGFDCITGREGASA